ncbi:MAG: hypothetical protein J6R29_01670 [Clostridia bacterium]|nr:hypothetical protein [Clostridia bacterium]
MAITPRLEKVTFQKSVEVTNKNKVECKLGVYEEDSEVLCSNARACLINTEISDGEIRFNGKAIFNAVCVSGKELKKAESGVEFSFKFNSGIKEQNQTINLAEVEVLDVDVSKQNGVLIATAVLLFKGEVLVEEENEQVSTMSAGFLIKKNDAEKSEVVGKAQKTFTVQDDFEVQSKITDVICHNEKVILSNCQSGIGCVILDGEVEVLMALKTVQEENNTISEKRRIPFRFELELNEAMPNNIALSNVSVTNSSVKVYVDENKNKSTVTVLIETNFSAVVYEINSFTYCEDAYSTTCNLKLDKALKTLETVVGSDIYEQKIVSDLAYYDENALLTCVLNDKIEELEASFKNGAISVKGALSVSPLYNINGELKCQTSLVPFETSFNASSHNVKNVKCAISNVEVEKVDGKFVCSFTLKVYYSRINLKTVNVLRKVEEGDKKKVNDSAISVYIASKGEDLWSVCKALNASEEVILASNSDLAFPLEKEERILIYRELNKDEI